MVAGQEPSDAYVSFSLKFWSSNFLGIVLDLPLFDVNERLYSAYLKGLLV